MAFRVMPIPFILIAIGVVFFAIGIFWWPLLITGLVVLGIAGIVEILQIWNNIPRDLQKMDEQFAKERQADNERVSSMAIPEDEVENEIYKGDAMIADAEASHNIATKVNLGAFGAELRASFENEVAESVSGYHRIEEETKEPNFIEEEIRGLLFFAYDYAICSGNETTIRERIKQAFVASKILDLTGLQRMLRLSQEYAKAFTQESDEAQQYSSVAKMFASNTKTTESTLVIDWASNIFRNTYLRVSTRMKDAMKLIELTQ